MTIRKTVVRLTATFLTLFALMLGASLSGTTGAARAGGVHTYKCNFFHVSITIPNGWTADAGFASQNTVCTDLQSYTSPEFNNPKHSSAFVLNNEEGASAASPRAAILAEATNFSLVTVPSNFKTIRGNAGGIVTATVLSATSASSAQSAWFFGAACQKHYCITFISFTAAHAPKSISATVRAALQSLRFLPGASTAFAPPAKLQPAATPAPTNSNSYSYQQSCTDNGATCSTQVCTPGRFTCLGFVLDGGDLIVDVQTAPDTNCQASVTENGVAFNLGSQNSGSAGAADFDTNGSPPSGTVLVGKAFCQGDSYTVISTYLVP